ncbi:MAG: tripartite tricarboxylate transporter substrate-binding protein [Burkholderiaceae bacterium]|jgi:tripartite-type tricarboxylate transporter receptor subunit TctC|nr:tripartite tricarboxylate transporter substrate-binding protein [Burkholderiaceae bacterium]
MKHAVGITARIVAALGLSLGVVAGAMAQAFPSKPVQMVVPFTAGGPTDTVGRSLAQAMSKHLGQQIVIENVGGAGGTVGAARVKNAAADGYSLLLHHIGMSTAPSLYRKLAFNPQTDFEAIGLVVDVPMTLIARSDFPAENFADFLKYAKANKAKMNLGNAGVGAASHLCGLLFMSAIDTDFTTVPFKGTADVMNALLAKQIDFTCDQTTNTTGQIQAHVADKTKGVKVYGVTSAKRVATLPNVPTLQEGGLKGFEVGVWHGVYAPKGTPKPVVDRLVAALQAAAKDPEFTKRMADLGATVYAADRMTPAAHAAHLKAEIERWAPIIKKAGAYAD